MIEYLAAIDPDRLQAWIGVLMGFLVLLRWYADNRQRDKWELIREAAPRLVAAVDRMAKETPTKKDDAFVELMRKALVLAGYKLDSGDEDAVKAIGSGEKELAKKSDPR